MGVAEGEDAREGRLQEGQVHLRTRKGLLLLVRSALLALSHCRADNEGGDLKHHLDQNLHREVIHVILI